MNNTILTVLSLSASGTVLVLLLLALRPLLKNKVSKAFQYYIWLLVLLRLALPLSFSGSIANQIVSQTVPPQAPVVSSANDNKGTPTQGDIVAQGNGQTAAQGITSAETAPHGIGVSNPGAQASEPTHLYIWRLLLEHQTAIWLLGALIHFGWFIITYLRFSRKIRGTSVRPHPMDREVFVNLRGNANVQLVCSPYIDTPMLIGILSPCIVIPHLAFVVNGMKPELQHILRHELTHYRRRDLLYKWFVVLVSSLHWFNPLMMLVRREINRACELSCDEAVIGSLHAAARQSYGETLLALASNKRLPTGIVTTTMCEEKRELKERLESIMTYKNKGTYMVVLSLVLALSLAGCSVALGAANGSPTPGGEASQSPTVTDTPIGPTDSPLQTPDEVASPTPAATNTPSVSTSSLTKKASASPKATKTPSVPAGPSNSVLEAYIAVLQNKAEFFSTDNKKKLLLNDFLTNQELYQTTFTVTHFSVLDLDGDKVPEVVLELSVGDAPQFFEVLHAADGVVNGYQIVYRGLNGLKADGTFGFSSGAADSGWGKLRFGPDSLQTDMLGYSQSNQGETDLTVSYFIGDEPVTKESFDSAINKQYGKKDAAWYEFSQKKIESELSANQ